MARKRKGNPLGALILLGIIFVVSKWDEIVNYFTHNGLYFAAAIAVIMVFIIIGRIRAERDRKKTASDDVDHFYNAVKDFLPVLSRKQRFLTTADDYGYVDASRWESEKASFLGKLGYCPLTCKGYSGLNRASQANLIDDFVAYYDSHHGTTLAYSDGMSPIEYEAYCAEVLKENGWSARTTKASGDQGVDVMAEINGNTVAIQCKKYSRPIGNSAVQEVSSGAKFWGAAYGVVVTNATYTRSARQLANAEGVLLIHHEELPQLKEMLGL